MKPPQQTMTWEHVPSGTADNDDTRAGIEWPIAARETELATIADAVTRGDGVFLSGAAGVGKTRLMAAVLERVAAGGVRVRSIVAAPRAVRSPLRDIEELSAGGPLVVGVDDAHRLDSVTATDLYRLAATGRVTLMLSARAESVLTAEVAKLWLDGLVTRTDLAPFDRAAVAQVLAARLGGEVPEEIVADLHDATLGNALLLRELVEHGLADASLRAEGGCWSWSGLRAVDNRLADLVRVRLGALDRDEWDLVNMIALADCADADAPPWVLLAHAAESLNQRDVLVAEPHAGRLRLRLRYPLYGTVLAAAMPELTKRRLHRRLIDESCAVPAPQDDVPFTAFEQVEAGDAAGALRRMKRDCPPLEACDDRTWVAYQTVTAFAALEAGERADIVAALARLCQHPAHVHRADIVADTCAVAEFVHGCVDRAEGRLAQAVERLRRAHTLAEEASCQEWPTSPAMVLAQLAGALAEAGRCGEATAALAKARAALVPPYPRAAADGDHVGLAAVVVAAHSGNDDAATRAAAELAERATAAGRAGLALGALHLFARAGSPANAARLLRTLDLGASTGAATLRMRHIGALDRGDRDALARVAAKFAKLGWRPLAAEAAAQAQDESHRSGGRRWNGQAAAELANILAGYPGKLPSWVYTPERPGVDVSPILTPREREVAAYAAEGLTNQEIADQLVISIRTVENHLQRTYTKLGINTRSSLMVHVAPDLA